MLFGFDLKELFYFPFKDEDARKHLLIGALIALSAFIIPILPIILLTGYAAQIAKQVMNHESPRMVAWDNWSDLFKDGLKVFGVRLIYSLPIIVLVLPLMITSFIMPVVASNSNSSDASPIIVVFMGIFALTLCILIPLSIVMAFVIPAAEMHVIEKDDFAAGFRMREWWSVFRANMSGFIAAFAIYYLAAMALAIVSQLLMVTVILSCLVPFILPATTIYIMLIMYATVGQAYRDGKTKLAQSEVAQPTA